MKSICVIGASKDRAKFGNKCVRAYLKKGFAVYPINPNETEIEGLPCYKSLAEIGIIPDIVSIYLNPRLTEAILPEIIAKKPGMVYFNPGTEDDKFDDALEKAGIKYLRKCSILAIGINTADI